MSRTNPTKRKKRAAKTTILIYGEGQSDEIFIKHLRSIYSQNSGAAVTIKKGKGGTPEGIVRSAINYIGAYDRKYIVIDNDKSLEEIRKAQVLATQHNIVLIKNSPCLEAMLLIILQDDIRIRNKTSKWCKSEFERHYISKKQRTETHRYERLFPKSLIDKQRYKIQELDQFISIMENN